jgi:gluconate 2-dehydrogenase gamma chain
MRGPATNFTLTRRQFALAGALGGAAAVIGCRSASRGSWDFLTESQAHTLAALCDQIIPADDFPSASQAGVIVYIDRQLARHYRLHQDVYRDGLAQLDAMSRQRFSRGFSDCVPDTQIQIAVALEKEAREFFELVRQHTMEGYYGSPRHGGNRDAVSWRMLGLAEPPLRGRPQYDLRRGIGA